MIEKGSERNLKRIKKVAGSNALRLLRAIFGLASQKPSPCRQPTEAIQTT
jgi:hypothetical protein